MWEQRGGGVEGTGGQSSLPAVAGVGGGRASSNGGVGGRQKGGVHGWPPRLARARACDVGRGTCTARGTALRLCCKLHAASKLYCTLCCAVLHCARTAQNSAWPGHLGKGMTSRMFSMPVANRMRRSKPRPKPVGG